jgi:sugar diacid utilization regulator
MFIRVALHHEQQDLRMEQVLREESLLVTRMVSEDARVNHHDIVAFGADLGYKTEHPMGMIVASLEASYNHCMNMNLGYESATNEAKTSIIQRLKEHACMNRQDIMAFVQNNYLVVLKAIEDCSDRRSLYRVMDKVAEAVGEVLNSFHLFRCYVAPPEIMESFDRACLAYRSALDCISYARRMDLDHSIITYDDVLYRLFASQLPDKIQVECIAPRVQVLLSQNPEMVQSLIQCFEAYSNNGLNVATTAEVVYMHRNTVKKKLEKLYQLTGVDPAGDFTDLLMNKLILEQYQAESRGL